MLEALSGCRHDYGQDNIQVPPVTFVDHHHSSSTLDAPAREFVLWLLNALGLHVRSVGDNVYQIDELPSPSDGAVAAEHLYAALSGRRFTFDQCVARKQSVDPSRAIEFATWQSPLLQWLLDELQQGALPVNAAAARQPLSVHELAEHLFAQYQVDGGHMHLAGCNLEDRPFLRLSYLEPNPVNGDSQLVHCFGTSEGKLLDGALRESLDLDDLVPIVGRAPRIDDEVLRRWSELTRQQFDAQQSDKDRLLIATTLVWCKYAEGKLTFSIGQKSAEISFSGWGRMIADRRRLPPPYHCPLSGQSSYHLGATDDGRITVVEAIGTCTESSRRVLVDDLQLCAVTRRRALPEYLQECPCTGEQVLVSALVACDLCQQPVSPHALVDARCSACRDLKPVTKTATDLVRVLDAYPKLDKLRNWKMAKTRTVWTFVGSSAWKRLLVVLNAETLEVLHMANGRRLSSTWVPADDLQRAEWLD